MLVTRRGGATAADIEAARRASLGDAEIVEIIAAVAINIFTNYVNIAADTEVDFPPAGPLPRAA
jgi:alkylhydroperoxidase family enzyme